MVRAISRISDWLKSAAAPRDGLWLGLLVAVLTSLPFLFVRYPQMDDYPSHLARFHIMLDAGHSPDLARFYSFTWQWSGNQGVDLLIGPLARLTGLETAGWLIAALIPLLTGLGLVAVEWSLRQRVGAGTLLAMCAIWSMSLRMGFLNFTLALALALWAFAAWVRLRQSRWRGVLFLPFSLAIWVCHMSGWGVLGLMVFGYEWQRRGTLLSAALCTWPLWPPVLPILIFGGTQAGLNYGPDLLSYKKDIFVQALRGDVRLLDIACVGLLVLAMVEARSRKVLDWQLMRPALLLLAVALVMPRHLGGGDFADARLIPVVLMLGCMAIDAPMSRRILLLAAVPVLIRLGLLTANWHAQSTELEEMLPALDRVPVGARVASAVAEDADAWAYPVFSHVGAFATVRRDALVNAHFAVAGVHMLGLRTAGPEFADPSQQVKYHRGETVDLSRFAPAQGSDFLWYIGPRQALSLPDGAQFVFGTQGSLLAKLPAAASRPTPSAK